MFFVFSQYESSDEEVVQRLWACLRPTKKKKAKKSRSKSWADFANDVFFFSPRGRNFSAVVNQTFSFCRKNFVGFFLMHFKKNKKKNNVWNFACLYGPGSRKHVRKVWGLRQEACRVEITTPDECSRLQL